jgi:hypothetical protein
VDITVIALWLGHETTATTQIYLQTDLTFWADTTVVHLIINGARLKTVPSRLTITHLRRLLADGARPAAEAVPRVDQPGAALSWRSVPGHSTVE